MVAEANQTGLKWLERTIPGPPISYAAGGFLTRTQLTSYWSFPR
ncbi:MAG: hypothetical protein ACFFD4_22510 [Candidatus Odinarchaeota archaeon]